MSQCPISFLSFLPFLRKKKRRRSSSNSKLFFFPRARRLAGAEHLLEGGLLGGGDGELVGALDLDPGGGVLAVDLRPGGLPLVGALVALLGVGGAGDGPELDALDVVGEGLAVGGGPLGSARLFLSPSVLP